MLLGQRGTNVR